MLEGQVAEARLVVLRYFCVAGSWMSEIELYFQAMVIFGFAED